MRCRHKRMNIIVLRCCIKNVVSSAITDVHIREMEEEIMASGASGNARKAGNSTAKKKNAGRTATGRTSTTRNSNNKRTSRKKTGKAAEIEKKNKLREDIILLVTSAFALILFLSNCNLAGTLGEKIKWLMFGIMGVTSYVFPVILAGSVVFLAVNKDLIGVARIKTAAVYVLMTLVSGLWLRVTEKPTIDSTIGTIFTYSAEQKSSGGFFGAVWCKLLEPLGLWGSLVVLTVLAVICIVVITEKSFINGIYYMKNSGSKLMKNAKEDYSAYKEHSNERMEQQLQARKEREQRADNARMNKKVRGVTSDTTLVKDMKEQLDDIDIHEIQVDVSRQDEYSDDIYDPTDTVQKAKADDRMTYEEEYEAVKDIKSKTPSDISGSEQQASYHEDVIHREVQQDEVKHDLQESTLPAHKKYVFPPLSLLGKPSGMKKGNQDRENKETAVRLQQTLQSFGVKATITDISCGPAVTRYELQPEQGVKVSRIVSLSDDIKLNLAAADIRIEAPIPGKAAIGIEVPNKEAGSVYLREILESDAFKKQASPIAFAAGKDIAGKPIVADIAKMPHLLIAGATGSGKSVCINTIIMSILYKASPDEVKMIMIDPKMVELSAYNGIPHLLTPVVTDPKKASGALNWAVVEMTDRYKKFTQMNVRDIKGYNARIEKMDVPEGEQASEKMPHMVIIIDELADLMMVAPGEVEDAICRLAQLARAAGIHLVIATQRPSVNVITGLIKANVPSRIAFSVSSGVDSRTIIDMNGAEKLLGKGDMLFFPSGYPKPVRVQGAFCTDEEVAGVVEFLKEHTKEEVTYNEEITKQIVSTPSVAEQQGLNKEDERDSYFADAGRFVIGKEKGSIGMLQRYYKIGFNRAGRIMDQLAEAGVVGPELGTKPRKVEMTLEEFESFLQKNNIN